MLVEHLFLCIQGPSEGMFRQSGQKVLDGFLSLLIACLESDKQWQSLHHFLRHFGRGLDHSFIPIVGEIRSPLISQTAIIRWKGGLEDKGSRGAMRSQHLLMNRFPYPARGFPLQPDGTTLFLVFEKFHAQGVGTPSDELNLCLHRTHGAGADPAIDEGCLPGNRTIVPQFATLSAGIVIHIKPSPVFGGHSKRVVPTGLRKKAPFPDDGKLFPIDLGGRTLLPKVKLNDLVHPFQFLLVSLIHPLGLKIGGS